jgi:hypothetical protein
MVVPSRHLAHHFFAVASGIGLGVVEEVDAGIESRRHHLDGRLVVDLVVVGDPRAQREHAELQAGAAEAAVVHGGDPDLERLPA